MSPWARWSSGEEERKRDEEDEQYMERTVRCNALLANERQVTSPRAAPVPWIRENRVTGELSGYLDPAAKCSVAVMSKRILIFSSVK